MTKQVLQFNLKNKQKRIFAIKWERKILIVKELLKVLAVGFIFWACFWKK